MLHVPLDLFSIFAFVVRLYKRHDVSTHFDFRSTFTVLHLASILGLSLDMLCGLVCGRTHV